MSGIESVVTTSPIQTILTLLVSGGLLKYLIDWLRDGMKTRRQRPTSAQARRQETDASVLTMARAQDELESLNRVLRENLDATQAAHSRDIALWNEERARFLAEITRLQAEVARERAESDQRYERLQGQIRELRRQHEKTNDTPPNGMRRVQQ